MNVSALLDGVHRLGQVDEVTEIITLTTLTIFSIIHGFEKSEINLTNATCTRMRSQ